jgi:hypothetical protein
MDPEAQILKFFGSLAAISITVKNNLDSGSFKCFQFVEDINHSSIIGRMWNIEGNDMKIFCRHTKLILPERSNC